MSIGVLVGLGSTILLIGTLLIFGATREPLLKFFDWIFVTTTQFISLMPKALKMVLFLFFLIFIVGSAVNLFLGFLFFCDGTTVYQPDNLFTGIGLSIAGVVSINSEYGNLTTSQYESILNNESILYSTPDSMTPEGLIQIKCQYNEPVFTIFGIEVFNYRLWILLFILTFFIWFIIKIKF